MPLRVARLSPQALRPDESLRWGRKLRLGAVRPSAKLVSETELRSDSVLGMESETLQSLESGAVSATVSLGLALPRQPLDCCWRWGVRSRQGPLRPRA